LHRSDAQCNNSCIIAYAKINFSSFHASTSYHSLHRVANKSNRSGIKYTRINRRISEGNICNIKIKFTKVKVPLLPLLFIEAKYNLQILFQWPSSWQWKHSLSTADPALTLSVCLDIAYLALPFFQELPFLLKLGLFWIAITWLLPVLFLMSPFVGDGLPRTPSFFSVLRIILRYESNS
jgi:hypothetical protein